MKRVHELTEDELLLLDDETIKRLIDYECALEGVPMLPPAPGPAPTKEFPDPDIQCFSVAGVITRDSAHATRILDAINSGALVETTYETNYNNRYLKPLLRSDYSYPKIVTEIYRSAEQWDAIKNEHSKFEILKSEWDEVNNEYSKGLKERAAITDAVMLKISNARQSSYARNRIRQEFARYLELAEGNRQIALNFLEKAKDLSEFPELREEFMTEGINNISHEREEV